jgi:anti-anti-sigma regulatory factor
LLLQFATPDRVSVGPSTPLEERADLAVSVERVQDPVVLSDATQAGRFRHDRARRAAAGRGAARRLAAAVAHSLIRAASALRLLGVDVVLTGVSAGGAQALVSLDVDLGPLMTKTTLELGIAYALSCVGQRWVRESEADTAPPWRPGAA